LLLLLLLLALPATPFKGSTTPAGDILLEGEKKLLRGLHDAGILL
jgi:hypothetical protein